MKKILLPDITFGVQINGSIKAISAAEQLRAIASSPSKPGDVFTIDQIRARLPLVEKLIDDPAEVLIEDSEYAELLEAVRACTWQGVSRAAVELVDAVEAAEEVKVKER